VVAALESVRRKPEPASSVEPAVGVYDQDPPFEPGDAFRDCEDCPLMVVVPAGSLKMGSPQDEQARAEDEGPQHRVTITRPFAVGQFEVTFAEWDSCVADGGCDRYRPNDEGWGRGSQPVINVSWEDAQNYLSWLRQTTGQEYRLPSEAQWEYAARAGTVTPFHTGQTISFDWANYGAPFNQQTSPGGKFPPNPFGLHDMHGNVWEWVEDCENNDYSDAPTDGSAWTEGDCAFRMTRGGSWVSSDSDLRSAARGRQGPSARRNDLGFRVARVLIP
jgi:formylglycine-generating enzyme required for sulfatase activity